MLQVIATCVVLAAQAYSIPPEILFSIHKVEGGQIGQVVGPNTNGSYDIGPMQINTIWIPELADHWGVDKETAFEWVRDDACTNTGVAAWILRNHLDETGDIAQAIAHYHSRTPDIGKRYQTKVIKKMFEYGFLDGHNPS